MGWTAPRGNGTPWTCVRRSPEGRGDAGRALGGTRAWESPGPREELDQGHVPAVTPASQGTEPKGGHAGSPRGPVRPWYRFLGDGHCPALFTRSQPQAFHFITHGSHLTPLCSACCVLSRVRLCVTPPDCSPPASSVHGILQARILESSFPKKTELSFPSPGDLPDPGIKPGFLLGRQVLYHLSHLGSPLGSEGANQ